MCTATVAICTYNRADCLADAVRSVVAQEAPFPFEVMVIDNKSTDGTRELVAELQRELPDLRYVVEENQGLSHARNRALVESEAEIVAYIDDDAVAHAGWLTALVAAFSDPSIAVAGGRIEVFYPVGRPDWVTDSMEAFLSRYDAGDACLDVDYVVGANFAVRRETALAIGGFDVNFGFCADALLPGEETELCLRARRHGYRIRYTPEATVAHRANPQRLVKRVFAMRLAQGAVAQVRMGSLKMPPLELARAVAWCRVNALARRWRGERIQAFHWDLERVQLSATLAATLPGPAGVISRVWLCFAVGPQALRWAVGVARAMAAGRTLGVPPLECPDHVSPSSDAPGDVSGASNGASQ